MTHFDPHEHDISTSPDDPVTPDDPVIPGDPVIPEDPTPPARPAPMVRSEEQLQVRTQTAPAGRVRLVKRIVTEDVTFTVPVSHEEVTIEREAITDANRGDAADGVELTEHAWDLVLYTEKVDVIKTTVPVERVQLSTHIVTEQRDVTETLRKEQFQVDQTPPPNP